MDVIYFMGSINKLSLLAFLLTLGVLAYEIILFKKEAQRKSKPKVPNFQEGAAVQVKQSQTLVSDKAVKITRPNNIIFVTSIILVIVFGVAALIGFTDFGKKISKSPDSAPTSLVDFVYSKGIKIFDGNFEIMPDDRLASLKPGTEIIVGVETVPGTDVDRARIRLNKDSWDIKDITTAYSEKFKVYYIKYTVASGEAKLKVEAQLHSAADGWLGD